jgi:hypothetical protein
MWVKVSRPLLDSPRDCGTLGLPPVVSLNGVGLSHRTSSETAFETLSLGQMSHAQPGEGRENRPQ